MPDVPVCIELSPSKGFCTYTISDKEQIVDDENKLNGESYWEMRPKMILVPAVSYAEIKSAFIKICKKYGSCSKDLTSWDRKIKKIDKVKERK